MSSQSPMPVFFAALCVGLVSGGLERRLVGIAADRHLAPGGRGGERRRRPARARPSLSIRAYRTEDERGIFLDQLLRVETVRRQRPRRKRFDEDVGSAGELTKSLGEPWLPRVEANAALSGGQHGEEDARVRVRRIRPLEAPQRVPVRRLHHGHVGSVGGEQLPRQGAARFRRKLHDTNSFEHPRPPLRAVEAPPSTLSRAV
jgi:hypothetical protein